MSQQQFSSPEPRLDADAVRRVIDRAAALQQAHLETVSPDQIEALASEVGINPEFVRRALSEAENEPITETRTKVVRRKIVRKKAPLAALSARQVRTALTPGAVYAVFAGLAITGFNSFGDRNVAEIILLMIQPAILVVYFGAKQPHRRMGALVGMGMGMLPILASAMTGGIRNMPVAVGLIYGPMLAALGFSAAAARKWLDERQSDEIIEEIVHEPAR